MLTMVSFVVVVLVASIAGLQRQGHARRPAVLLFRGAALSAPSRPPCDRPVCAGPAAGPMITVSLVIVVLLIISNAQWHALGRHPTGRCDVWGGRPPHCQ